MKNWFKNNIYLLLAIIIVAGISIAAKESAYVRLQKSDWQEIKNFDQCKLDATCVMFIRIEK